MFRPEHIDETPPHFDYYQTIMNIAVVYIKSKMNYTSAIPILSEWCSWSLTAGEAVSARDQLEEVLSRAGADPLSGKVFWDAKLELEKAKLDTMA